MGLEQGGLQLLQRDIRILLNQLRKETFEGYQPSVTLTA